MDLIRKMIQVTKVNIYKAENLGAVEAIASIVINNAIAINNIKIINGKNGLFIAMPSRKASNGEFKDIVYPINTETREIIEKAILTEYKD